MDGYRKKDAFIGFKIEQSLKNQLKDVAKRKGFTTLSKFICYICLQYLRNLTLSAGDAK